MSVDLLPAGWIETTVGELCEERVAQAPPSNGPIQYIDIGSIDRKTKRIGETEKVDRTTAPSRARQWVRTGDVLVSMTRPNLNAVAMVTPDLDGAVASTGFDVLRARRIDPRWLYARARTRAFVQDICKGLQGVVYPAVRPRDIRSHRLPVPPSGAEVAILDALDSYVSRLESAEDSLARARRNLERFRTSVRMAAIEGRLVPTEAELARAEGRPYEPATELLARILEARRRSWEETGRRGIYRDPVAPNAFSLPALPEGWCWATVDQLSVEVRYGSSAKASSDASGVPVVRMGNIANGELDLSDLKYLPTDHPEFPDLLLAPGDILFNRTNSAELVGKSAIFAGHPQVCSFASYLIRVRPFREASAFLIVSFLNSPSGRAWAASVASQQVGQANINGTKLKALVVPVPPQAEALRIEREAARLLSVMRAQAAALSDAAIHVRRLREGILDQAFDGRLLVTA